MSTTTQSDLTALSFRQLDTRYLIAHTTGTAQADIDLRAIVAEMERRYAESSAERNVTLLSVLRVVEDATISHGEARVHVDGKVVATIINLADSPTERAV